MEENTSGGTAQIVGAVSLVFGLISVVLSIGAAFFGLCCFLLPMASSVLSGLSGLVSVGGMGFGFVTMRNEELSEEQAGKAKMGFGLAAVAFLMSLVAVAIACGPTIVVWILSIVSSLLGIM